MPFAPSAEEPLLPLSLEEPFLAAAEEAMVSAVQASLKEAETLRQQLDEVAATLRAAAALPIDADGKVNLAELGKILESFQQAESRLRKLTTRVVARIFLVDGEKAKGMLRTRVNNLKDELCNQALAWVENEVSSLHKAWEVALSKASMVPASEQELVELKRYLAVVHQETAPLIARGQTLTNLMSLLEQHFVFTALRVQKQAFELDCCPMKLKMALCETNGILDLAKERLEARRQISAQHLQTECEALRAELDAATTMFKHVEECASYRQTLEKLSERVYAARSEIDNLRKAEALFGLEASEFEELEGVCVVFDRLNELWTAAFDFTKNREEWKAAPLAHLDCADMEEKLQQWRQAVSSLRRMAGIFRSVEPLQACDELLQAIVAFQKMLPLMKTLTHPSFQAKHWQELATRLEVDATEESGVFLSLNTLIQRGLPEATQAIELIGSAAFREFRTKACFQKMRGAWRALRMDLVTLGDASLGRKILKGFDAVHSLIEEHQASVQSLQASQLVGGVELQAREWLRKLSDLDTLCNLLEACQVSWVYLVPIFDYPEMQQQLAKEADLLSSVGKLWKDEVISRLDENSGLLDLADLEELPQKLRSACIEMQSVVKGLNEFLERKRLAFPRFFFLSNEELVQLLAGASHAEALVPHIQKCFEGISSMKYDQDSNEANIIISHRQETLQLLMPVQLAHDGKSISIEDVFSSIEREMCAALQHAMQRAWEEFPAAPTRLLWATERCGCSQAALAIAHCCWTTQVEAAILQHQLPQLVKDLQHQLQQLVEAVRGPLSPDSRSVLATLLTLDVHCRDVAEELRQKKTSHMNQFEWICHLRSYWTPGSHHLGGGAVPGGYFAGGRRLNRTGGRGTSGGLQICMLESSLNYGFELLRSPDRLVVTPLTDRCYRTLMTALHFQYGGAPEGPAGTGKTETTKDLAKAVGKPCLVFNCSEGLDATAMAALLKGIAASGGWCCFDEFNRLQLDVLSIVALQISAIQQAIRRNAITFVFEDTDLQLNPTCAINITMNPGYAGRATLPDTLKALFRPCAMMVPDASLIAEVVLYCSGFQDAYKLSKKVSKRLHIIVRQAT
ncbi:Dynein heavy chain 7, related [Eimeria tenella]|uniref:Dynein heavy chain 7, related n=1 Tax=Eimeria tenella TaxID=5802 RepID=U6KW65_EIMTE|nr:Dynein heavy chain 7, related [Eimeria tenella]CDJ41168.1 Dynein heavy chain 7, related [Eimeria tenella]|eukprot:XP_013231918.1 Dynein heavy chain 7, related [Eimeria tenella]